MSDLGDRGVPHCVAHEKGADATVVWNIWPTKWSGRL